MARTRRQPRATNEGRSKLSDLRLNDSESILDFVSFWRENRQHVLGRIERKALIQISWVLGHQAVAFDGATSELIDQSDADHTPWWRVNAVENRLLPLVEGRLSKLLSRQPLPKPMPATSDEEDEQVAVLQGRALRHYWRNVLGMAERLWQVSWWAEVTGTGFFVTGWDPNAGPSLTIRPSQFVDRFNSNARPDASDNFFKEIFGSSSNNGPKRQPLGDVFVDVRTVFDVLVDPTARTMDEAEWALVSRFRNVDDLKQKYGSEANDLEPGLREEHAENFHRVHDMLTGSLGDGSDVLRDQVLTWELWTRQSDRRPGGLHAVVSQDTLLQRQPNPYSHGEIPITAIQGIKVPMSVYGTCKVAQLLETQERLNDIRSEKTEFMRMHVHPKVMEPDLAETDDNAFTTEFGEIIRYRHPFRPEYLIPPPMPSYVQALEEDAIRAMQDLGDLHEVSVGNAPAGLRSGRAILALQAQDEARFGPVIKHRNQSLGRLGRQILSLLAQFVTERRMIQIVGDDLITEVQLFHSIPGFIGSELIGRNRDVIGVDYFRVEMEVDSELPLSPEGQRLVIGDLIANGVLNPEQDKDMILRLSGLPSSEPLFERARSHRSMAVRENREMADGKTVIPFKWNDHLAHLDVHTRFMNSMEFRQLGPEAQLRFQNHLTRHHHMHMMEVLRPQFLAAVAQQTMPDVMRREMQSLDSEPAEEPEMRVVDGQLEALLSSERAEEPALSST